jgi:hypothetical protein
MNPHPTMQSHIRHPKTGGSVTKRDLLYLGSDFWAEVRNGNEYLSPSTDQAWDLVGTKLDDVWVWLDEMEKYIKMKMKIDSTAVRENFWSIDHMIPQKKQGPDHFDNYFLLPQVSRSD